MRSSSLCVRHQRRRRLDPRQVHRGGPGREQPDDALTRSSSEATHANQSSQKLISAAARIHLLLEAAQPARAARRCRRAERAAVEGPAAPVVRAGDPGPHSFLFVCYLKPQNEMFYKRFEECGAQLISPSSAATAAIFSTACARHAPPPARATPPRPLYHSSSCCGRGKCKEGQRRCTGAPGRAERVDRPVRLGAARSHCTAAAADAARCSVPVAAGAKEPHFPENCSGSPAPGAASLSARQEVPEVEELHPAPHQAQEDRVLPQVAVVQVCDGLEGVDATHLQARTPGGKVVPQLSRTEEGRVKHGDVPQQPVM